MSGDRGRGGRAEGSGGVTRAGNVGNRKVRSSNVLTISAGEICSGLSRSLRGAVGVRVGVPRSRHLLPRPPLLLGGIHSLGHMWGVYPPEGPRCAVCHPAAVAQNGKK